jgi:oxygen-independent coproporphyrinogen III oxidase
LEVGPGLGGLYQPFALCQTGLAGVSSRFDGQFQMVYSLTMQPISLYIHIPFCIHRCAYCDFNTYAGLDYLIPDYIEALCSELKYISSSVQETQEIKTIFFGGGTPSLLPGEQLERVLLAIDKHFQTLPEIEITLEANPGTLTLEYLQNLLGLGVNRLSLGMQSANPRELQLLERQHSLLDVIQAVEWARQAGILNLNLDLIYGLPDQENQEWEKNLMQAINLRPDHLSLYALTLEHGTPMEKWVRRGLLSQPDQDRAAEMYEFSMDYLSGQGYFQYEISNWAMKDDCGNARPCLHNLQYWRNQPYLGVGAGAHGYANGVRVSNVLAPARYIHRYMNGSDERKFEFPKTPSTVNLQKIGERDEMAETMIMGLRLVQEGVSKLRFFQRFNKTLESVYGAEIDRLIKLGLLEWGGDSNNSLRLTTRGRLLGNQVFICFV